MHVEQANRHSQNEPSDPPTVNLLPKIDSRDLGPHLRTVCGKGPPALECVRHTPCSASRDCSVSVGARCWPLGWRGRFLFSLSVCKFFCRPPKGAAPRHPRVPLSRCPRTPRCFVLFGPRRAFGGPRRRPLSRCSVPTRRGLSLFLSHPTLTLAGLFRLSRYEKTLARCWATRRIATEYGRGERSKATLGAR